MKRIPMHFEAMINVLCKTDEHIVYAHKSCDVSKILLSLGCSNLLNHAPFALKIRMQGLVRFDRLPLFKIFDILNAWGGERSENKEEREGKENEIEKIPRRIGSGQ
jgi:hypothetical protein